jgi:hypothetical protein
MDSVPENIRRWMSPEDQRKYGLSLELQIQKDNDKSEKAMHKEFENWFDYHDIEYRTSRMDKPTREEVGMCDYQFWNARYHGFVELKVPGGRLSAAQHRFIARQVKKGVPVRIATSVEDAKQFVKTVLRLPEIVLSQIWPPEEPSS